MRKEPEVPEELRGAVDTVGEHQSQCGASVAIQPVVSAALVVEDESSFASLLCHSLMRAGIEATCVQSAEEAAVELSIRRFQFVLVDMTLPGSSGLYVVESVRKVESSRRPSVVVMTATRSPILDKLDRSVVKAVFFKPLNVDAMVAFVRALDTPAR